MATEDDIRLVVGRWRIGVKGKARRIITLPERSEMRMKAIRDRLYAHRMPLDGWEMRRCYYRNIGEYEFIEDWHPIPVGEPWGMEDISAFFRNTTTVPAEFAGHPVVMRFYIGGDSLLTLNGVPHHGVDPFRSDIMMVPEATGGEPLDMAIESYVSMHGGESDEKKLHISELCALDRELWDAYWDFYCVFKMLAIEDLDERIRTFLTDNLWEALKQVPLDAPDREAFKAEVRKAVQQLRETIYQSDRFKGEGLMHLCGHSHLDIVYLWPYREFVRKVGRTHSTMLRLMEVYPEFRFSQSQAKLYADMKEHYPALFAQVKQRVAEKRWEPIGAFWCEPDCNLISGESFVRQILYGQQFWQREFGLKSRTCWQPDVFGLSWGMPQILKRSGLEYIFTNKMFVWNDTNKWRDNVFWWEGLDGSRVLGVVPPSHFIGMCDPDHMDSHWRGLSCKTTVGETIYAYGWGDGGGGVDPEMLESARRYRDFPGLVPTTYSFVEEALDSIKAKAEANGAPVWSDELYLEAHRGTYTTKGKLKKLNRRLEFLLRDAEMASAFAWLAGGEYPRERIDEAWKTLLTNQFHDALPGTHVPQAYADMLRDYAHLLTEGAALRDAGLDAALADAGVVGATRTAEGMIQMVVVNTLLHQRTDVVAVAADAIGDATVLDMEGVAAPRQAVTTLEGERQVLLDIAGVSGCGYSTFALTDPVPEEEPCVEVTDRTLENDYLKATFNDEGELVSLFDKLFEREIVKPGALAHRFRLFEDIPGRYDAWDIIDGYRDHEIDISGNAELTVDEQGPVRASLRLVKRFLTSTIEQRISLSAGARQLVFETRVDWKERQKLLKDEFALNLNCRTATYDIAYGNIERSTHRNTPYDAAKFEVCGHLWADCSEGDYGVAILNDGKYGYEVNGATMQVSLLKGSIFPDPNADLEEHFFTYALYCHPGDWRAGEVMQEALQLNVPPVIRFAGEVEESDYSFIAGSAENVTLEAVKRAEDDQGLIVRLVERENRLTPTEVVFDRPVTQAWSCNLMEDTEDELTVEENRVLVTLKPYEIVTLRVIL